MSYDNLFQPLRIGGCTVPNRIARTAHSTGTAGEDLIAYHEERARGGTGLTVIEIAGVHTRLGDGHPRVQRRGAPVLRGARPPPARSWHAGVPAAVARRRGLRPGRPADLGQRRAHAVGQRDPGADDQGDDRRHRRRLRRGGQALPGRRARRRRAARGPRLPDRAVPLPGHQPARRRLRRLDGEPVPLPRGDPAGHPRRGRPRLPGRCAALGHRLHRGWHRPGRGGRHRPARRTADRLPRRVDVVVLAVPQVPVDHGRPARLRDPHQRAGHQGGGGAHHRDRSDHDPRPRQPPRGERRRRHGVDGAGDDRRPPPRGEGARAGASTRSGLASARAWGAWPS